MFDRTKTNFLDKWWIDIDKKFFLFFLFFSLFGLLSIFSASIPVANRIGSNNYFLFLKQAKFIIPSLLIFIFMSFLNIKIVKTTIVIYFFLSFLLLCLVPVFGYSVKGSRRWISLKIITLQPMEFVKSSFVLFHALILSEYLKQKKIKENLSSILSKEKAEYYLEQNIQEIENFDITKKELIIYTKEKYSAKPLYITYILLLISLYLLYKQPDIGNTLLLLLVVSYQVCLLDWVKKKTILFFSSLFCVIFTISYFSFPHVNNRVGNYFESFFNLDKAQYQIKRSIISYKNSNLLGNGFLEGEVKNYIPDAHTDFIFPVIAEEFGFLIVFIILTSYFFVSIRLLLKSLEYEDIFLFFALNGLSILFILQSIINIGVSLNLLPTKGMTLPFLSYGGSSTLSNSINFGYIMIFTKKSIFKVKDNFNKIYVDTEKLKC